MGVTNTRFEKQPHLLGELVELRPLRDDDFTDLEAAGADPLIWKQHPVPTRHEAMVFREFFAKHLASGGALAVINRRDGRIIGTTRFHGYDPERDEVEIGWTFLARPFWGGRYNGEMKRLMLAHAFRFVSRVVLLVHPQNVRSQRSVEKIGGVRVGSRKDASGRDSFLYEVRRSEQRRTAVRR